MKARCWLHQFEVLECLAVARDKVCDESGALQSGPIYAKMSQDWTCPGFGNRQKYLLAMIQIEGDGYRQVLQIWEMHRRAQLQTR
jgi:hypothetical protein